MFAAQIETQPLRPDVRDVDVDGQSVTATAAARALVDFACQLKWPASESDPMAQQAAAQFHLSSAYHQMSAAGPLQAQLAFWDAEPFSMFVSPCLFTSA